MATSEEKAIKRSTKTTIIKILVFCAVLMAMLAIIGYFILGWGLVVISGKSDLFDGGCEMLATKLPFWYIGPSLAGTGTVWASHRLFERGTEIIPDLIDMIDEEDINMRNSAILALYLFREKSATAISRILEFVKAVRKIDYRDSMVVLAASILEYAPLELMPSSLLELKRISLHPCGGVALPLHDKHIAVLFGKIKAEGFNAIPLILEQFDEKTQKSHLILVDLLFAINAEWLKDTATPNAGLIHGVVLWFSDMSLNYKGRYSALEFMLKNAGKISVKDSELLMQLISSDHEYEYLIKFVIFRILKKGGYFAKAGGITRLWQVVNHPSIDYERRQGSAIRNLALESLIEVKTEIEANSELIKLLEDISANDRREETRKSANTLLLYFE